MRLNLWTEIRTAAEVARKRRVSAAAEALGMHHSSVIRHIDALEARLHAKLFQRHARGYTPTEAGEDLLATATRVDEEFAQMVDRIEASRQHVSGLLVVTAIPALDQILVPAIGRFQARHPQVQVRYHSSTRALHLATGEAHVAIRAGPKPTQPDSIVTHLMDYHAALYAAPAYIRAHGRPDSPEELAGHRFVRGEEGLARAPFNQWLANRLPDENFVLRTENEAAALWAIEAGLGIGFLNPMTASPGMIELFPGHRPAEWSSAIWLITHVDLRRTSKISSFTRFMLEEAGGLATGPETPVQPSDPCATKLRE